MNDENLIPLAKRTQRERNEIARKGAKKSNEVQKQKKEEKEQRKSLTEILRSVVYSEITSKSIKNKIKEMGFEGSNYFTALCAFATVKGLKKGDFNAIAKIMELLGEDGKTEKEPEETESFKNLLGAIENVRKTKRKTK